MSGPIVVLGATGRVGYPVTEQLLAHGRRVRAVGRTADKLAPLARLGAEAYAGSSADPAFLARAFEGAEAAFLLTPVDVSAPDVNAVQHAIIDAVVSALRASRVRRVVLLSSWGAELTQRVGGILACHRFEQKLEDVRGLDAVRLRPVWFMENFLWNIPLLKMAAINGLAIGPHVRFPMISARDIAPVAVEYLLALSFRGHVTRYLNGPSDHTMTEVTHALGAAIGRPELGYVELPTSVFRRGLLGGGLTPDAADLAIEINRGIHDGIVRAEPRSALNTTPTTLDAFARSAFAPAFEAAPPAGFAERLGGAVLRSYLALTGRHAA